MQCIQPADSIVKTIFSHLTMGICPGASGFGQYDFDQ